MGDRAVGRVIEPLGAGLVVRACVWVVHASPCSMGMGRACVAMLCLHACVGGACVAMLFFFLERAPLCDFLEVRSQGEAAVKRRKWGGQKVLKLPKIQELKVLWMPSQKYKNP